MGRYKCAITHKPCPLDVGNWNDPMVPTFDERINLCPIGEYKDSSYQYKPGESQSGAGYCLDHTCRHLGIARADRIKDRDWYDK